MKKILILLSIFSVFAFNTNGLQACENDFKIESVIDEIGGLYAKQIHDAHKAYPIPSFLKVDPGSTLNDLRKEFYDTNEVSNRNWIPISFGLNNFTHENSQITQLNEVELLKCLLVRGAFVFFFDGISSHTSFLSNYDARTDTLTFIDVFPNGNPLLAGKNIAGIEGWNEENFLGVDTLIKLSDVYPYLTGISLYVKDADIQPLLSVLSKKMDAEKTFQSFATAAILSKNLHAMQQLINIATSKVNVSSQYGNWLHTLALFTYLYDFQDGGIEENNLLMISEVFEKGWYSQKQLKFYFHFDEIEKHVLPTFVGNELGTLYTDSLMNDGSWSVVSYLINNLHKSEIPFTESVKLALASFKLGNDQEALLQIDGLKKRAAVEVKDLISSHSALSELQLLAAYASIDKPPSLKIGNFLEAYRTLLMIEMSIAFELMGGNSKKLYRASKEAVLLFPDFQIAWINHANVLAELGEFDCAMAIALAGSLYFRDDYSAFSAFTNKIQNDISENLDHIEMATLVWRSHPVMARQDACIKKPNSRCFDNTGFLLNVKIAPIEKSCLKNPF